MTYKQYLNEVSDYKNLLQRVFEQIGDIEQYLPEETFEMKLEKNWFMKLVRPVKIKFKFGKNIKTGKHPINNNIWLVTIDSNQSLSDIKYVIAHETIHISQFYDGMEIKEMKKFVKEYETYKNQMTEQEFYDNVYHAHAETEQEAVKGGFFQLLKTGDYQGAMTRLQNSIQYFNFKNQQDFVSQAKEFNVSDRFIKEFLEELNTNFDHVLANLYSSTDIDDFYEVEALDIIFNVLEISKKDTLTKYYNIIKDKDVNFINQVKQIVDKL